MTTHYLRLPEFLQSHAVRHGADDERWAEEVFNDLTESGHALTTVPFPDGDKGPVLGLCGNRFFGKVCRDDRRPDCLFLFGLWKAGDKPPTVEPDRHEVGVRLLRNSDVGSPTLDSVDTLLSPIPQEHPEVEQPQSPSQAAFVEPSQELRAVVQKLDLDSIRQFCPGASANINEEDRKRWRTKLRNLCRRFGLKITDREQYILDTPTLNPQNIDTYLCRIGKAFDVAFLNRLGDAEGQKSLLLELLDLPAGAEATRRTLWLAWLSEQEPGTLKEELRFHADAGRLVPADGESDPHLDSFLLETLQEVGKQHNDDSLLALKERAADSATPWGAIAAWASKLVVRETASPRPDDEADIPKGNGVLKTVIESVEREPVSKADQATSDTSDGAETDTHLALETVPPERSETPQSERDRLASWIIAQRLSISDVEEATNIRQKAESVLKAFRDETLHTNSLEVLRNALSELQKESERALHLIPPSMEIDPLVKEAEKLVAALKQKLDRDPLPFLNEAVQLDALHEIASSEPMLSIMGVLPKWAVPPLSEGLPEDSTDRILIKCLREAKFRQNMERLGESLTRSGEDLERLLGLLPLPPSERDPLNYLLDWADQATEELNIIQKIKGPAENWTMETLTRWRKPRLATGIAYRLESLEGRVSAEVMEKITESVVELAEDDESRQATVGAAEQAVEKFESMLGGNATEVPIKLWDLAMKNAATSLQDTSLTSINLSINHNFVDDTGSRVNVTYVPHTDTNRPYGFVQVPLALESSRRVEADLALNLTVRTDHRDSWSHDWEDPGPSSLPVRYGEWKEVGNGRFQWTFLATIPIRDPSSSDVNASQLRVALDVSNHSGESLLDSPKQLEWSSLQSFSGVPNLNWPIGVKPNYVEEHPIGVQTEAKDLLKNLRDGGSFAVVAPRRFGKTTLASYIADEAGKSGNLLVLGPFTCTSYKRDEIHAEVWRQMDKSLVRKIGVGFTTDEPGDVPSTEVIKKAREGAWRAGYKGIVLLVDEAQLFFAGQDGSHVADVLKDRIETQWIRSEKNKLASVQFGFVGLPNLLERMGTNFSTLHVVKNVKLRNEEVNGLLLAVSRRQLQTTRAARQELAHRAENNLFILKCIVEQIQERLKKKKRLWFNDRDVEAAVSRIKASFEQEEVDIRLAQYLRDPLNEADSVNDWQPKPCYPLAVALASVGRGAQSQRRIEMAIAQVQKWCATLFAGEKAFKYTEERSKEDLQALRELGVYKDEGGFRSELLEGYLRYVGKDHFPKNDDQQAIIRCGVERIRKPKPLEFVAEGGQAKIYRFHKDTGMWAWRQIEFPDSDSDAYEKFLMTQEALHKLRDLQELGEEGSNYFYNILQVGISEDGYGVEMYRWIDGISLDEQVGTFSKEAAVDVGFKIGQAIKLIHRNDVLHRDISPRNIILTDTVPTLIDFGLARAAIREMGTKITGEDVPPEVQIGSPNWTKAADIYGLGVTIRKLLRPGIEGVDGLHALLNRCCSTEPSDRPDAGEFLQELDIIRKKLAVPDIRKKAWQEIESVPEKTKTFQRFLTGFQPQFEGIAIGLYPGRFEQCIVVADFLNKTLEAFGHTEDGRRLTLGEIKNGIEYRVPAIIEKFGEGPAIAFAHALRGGSGHWKGRHWKGQVLRNFNVDESDIHELILEAANQIKKGLDLAPLVNIVEKVLSSGTRH